jgi:hypothetical protein
LGPKIGISGTYEKTKGWELSYEKNVKWVVGAPLGNNKVQWEITKTNLDTHFPDTDLVGQTILVPAFLMFRVAKKKNEQNEYIPQKISAKLESHGKAKEDVQWWFDEVKEIEFLGPKTIELIK